MSLPASVNYAEPMATLPENTQSFSVVSQAVNGATFGPSSQIIVVLGNRGFLDPASLYFRYKVTWTSPGLVAAATAWVVGTPVYTPILRLDCLVNSQTIETINNYNTVCNMHTNLALSVADKLGQQYNLGLALLLATHSPTKTQMAGHLLQLLTVEVLQMPFVTTLPLLLVCLGSVINLFRCF